MSSGEREAWRAGRLLSLIASAVTSRPRPIMAPLSDGPNGATSRHQGGTAIPGGKRSGARAGGGSQSMAEGLRSEVKETRSLFAWLCNACLPVGREQSEDRRPSLSCLSPCPFLSDGNGCALPLNP
jgi:hypothetical protein